MRSRGLSFRLLQLLALACTLAITFHPLSTAAQSTSSSSTGGAQPEGSSGTVCALNNDPSLRLYPSGTKWENATAEDWLTVKSPGAPPRGYPQCWGQIFSSEPANFSYNCLEQQEGRAQKILSGEAQTEKTDASFIKGDILPEDVPINIVMSGGHRTWKMPFFPKVDEFAMLQVRHSFNDSDRFGHISTAFQIEFNGHVSPIKHRYGVIFDNTFYTNSSGSHFGGFRCVVVPFHTIVIDLSNGVVDSITFDDDCSLCGNDYCVNGNCARDISDCTASSSSGAATDCDFKLYVSWSGTDSDGTYLSSSGRRLSQFRRWSLNAVYNQASDFSISDLPIEPPDEAGALPD